MLIAFPNHPRRAWLIEPTDDGEFVGRVVGKGFAGAKRTAPGSLALVMDALTQPANRRGLPILVRRDRKRRAVA